MRTFNGLIGWSEERAFWESTAARVGFVPTMGALHDGHRSLLERARRECDRVVLSIFVNPTQFDDPSDLDRYPRTPAADVALAEGLADAVLCPTANEIYRDEYQYRMTEYSLSSRWEGAQRPGHFEGVLTVVLKLLNLVRPHSAYFGEKDWQQLQLVKGMARALFLQTEIVPCATVRESDGLAMSSRNRRLSPSARARASAFPETLKLAGTAAEATERLQRLGFIVDYVEDLPEVRLGAVRLEGVRLIDNVRR